MNPEGSYSFMNLDRPKYAHIVPWSGREYFRTLLIFYLMLFVLLDASEFGFHVLDWCRSCGGKHENGQRFATSYTHPIFSICDKWIELGKKWSFFTILLLEFLIVDLTLVFDDFFLNNQMVNVNANTQDLEERIRNFELQDKQHRPQIHANQEQQGNAEGGSSRDGPRRSSCQRTQGSNDAWFCFLFSCKTPKHPLLK